MLSETVEIEPCIIISPSVHEIEPPKPSTSTRRNYLKGRKLNFYKGQDRYFNTNFRWNKSGRRISKATNRKYHYMKCANYKSMKCTATAKLYEDEPNTLYMKKPHVNSCTFDIDRAEKISQIVKESEKKSEDAYRFYLDNKQECPNLKKLYYRLMDNKSGNEAHGMQVTNVVDGDNFSHMLFYSPLFLAEVLEFAIGHGSVDSTYKTCPWLKGCYHILFFNILVFGKLTTLFFCMMSRKTEKAYNAVLAKIRELAPNIKPKEITTGFDIELKDAMKTNFPEVKKFVGCYFDHCYNIDKQTVEEGLSVVLLRSDKALSFLKKVKGCALLPAQHIEETFEYLVDKLKLEEPIVLFHDDPKKYPLSDLFSSFIDYYRNFWLKTILPEGFSVFGEKNSINNNIERENHSWGDFGKMQPPLLHFLDALRHWIDSAHADYKERRSNLESSRKLLHEELKEKLITRGWEAIAQATVTGNEEEQKQVILTFLENYANCKQSLISEELVADVENEVTLESTVDNVNRNPLSERLIQEREISNILTCPVCFRPYQRENNFITHLKQNHNLMQCSNCRSIFKCDKEDAHECVSEDEETNISTEYVCQYCDKNFEGELELDLHEAEVHNVNKVYYLSSDEDMEN